MLSSATGTVATISVSAVAAWPEIGAVERPEQWAAEGRGGEYEDQAQRKAEREQLFLARVQAAVAGPARRPAEQQRRERVRDDHQRHGEADRRLVEGERALRREDREQDHVDPQVEVRQHGEGVEGERLVH